jgi:hypothetical protein
MLLDTPSINQLSTVISQVAGPAFLLAAQAEFLDVLISRMDRVVDRSRSLSVLSDDDPQVNLRTELPALQQRAGLLHRAIYWTVGSGVVTSLLVILAFLTAFFRFRHEVGAAIMFTIALAMFAAALIVFAREVKLAFSEVDQIIATSRSHVTQVLQ